MGRTKSSLNLVADIGGTNTRVALAEGVAIRAATIRRYRNAEHADLADVLRSFIDQEGGIVPRAACVAAAGPVRDGAARLTNLDWVIDRETIAAATGAGTVAVLNDLQAQGHGLVHLPPGNVSEVIAAKKPGHHAARLVIGVGTGLNAAMVYHTAAGTLVPAAEAGHITLPVQSGEDLRLAQFITGRHGFAAAEEVLSGRGLELLYHWVSEEEGHGQHLSAGEIVAACAEGGAPLARRAAEAFVRFLGRYAGNLALIQLPFGGIFLCGGVARALSPYFGEFGFAEAFRDKGRFSSYMEQFPASVIEDDYAALIGAASHVSEILGD